MALLTSANSRSSAAIDNHPFLSWETALYNSKFTVFHSEYWVLDSNSAIQNRHDLPAIACRSGEAGGPYLSHMSWHNAGQAVALPFTLVLVPAKKSS
jgi:hypothetical protein